MSLRPALLLTLLATTALAGPAYVAPKDPAVLRKLDAWGDRKFGLMMHWGPYSRWGAVESWSICPEDWIDRHGPYAKDYYGYKKAYEALRTEFDPVKFDPAKWARAAKDAGMGYVVFTTKHHDGFCMFDTKTTEYRITDSGTAFSKSPKANVTKEIFDAFRTEGFMVGAYFSKPDWHSENYWWSYYPPKDRNVNYDPKKFPERWSAFCDFTRTQIGELMSDYGSIDILWLDGGWVRPKATIDRAVDWQRYITFDQDIGMARIAAEARAKQPGLIVVDRTVGGEFENYTTPEQEVPESGPDHPWETCMTMAGAWSHYPNDTYKPTRKLVHTLVTVVSGGGNFLLNVAPDANGELDPTAYERLRDIGAWMRVNGEGIHGTRRGDIPSTKKIRHTRSRDGDVRYAFFLLEEGEPVPTNIVLPGVVLKPGATVTALGADNALEWKTEGDGMRITIPDTVREKLTGTPAVGIRMR
jgi:alpha-L-fucosidase